jgi:hypothetical protein
MGADTDAQWDEASALLAGQNRQTRSSADHKKLLVGGPLSDLLMPYRLMAIKPAILIPTKIPVLVFCGKLILRQNAWESKSFPGFVIENLLSFNHPDCVLWIDRTVCSANATSSLQTQSHTRLCQFL